MIYQTIRCVVAEVHNENLEPFLSLLRSHFHHVEKGEKDLPKFTLKGKAVEEWPDHLNTFIVFAKGQKNANFEK